MLRKKAHLIDDSLLFLLLKFLMRKQNNKWQGSVHVECDARWMCLCPTFHYGECRCLFLKTESLEDLSTECLF